ncbi:MAG: hypothetical protein ABIT20_12255 [Gemmatimonadaceae bacterium]
MKNTSIATRAVCAIAATLVVTSCGAGGIDTTVGSPISNNDTYATIGYLWSGARSAILNKREPSTDSFSLPLSYQLPCTRGGSGSFQGTLSGTKAVGRGTATLALTASLSACQFDDITVVRTVSASGVALSGSVGIVNDTWDAISIHMVAPTVTVNGVSCPGGIDVMITGTSPSAQPISTGTACGRTGAVPLP